MPTYMGRDNTLFYYITPKKVLHSYECNTFLGRNATPTIGMQHINIKWLSGNLVGISINLCKSIQKELFINDTP